MGGSSSHATIESDTTNLKASRHRREVAILQHHIFVADRGAGSGVDSVGFGQDVAPVQAAFDAWIHREDFPRSGREDPRNGEAVISQEERQRGEHEGEEGPAQGVPPLFFGNSRANVIRANSLSEGRSSAIRPDDRAARGRSSEPPSSPVGPCRRPTRRRTTDAVDGSWNGRRGRRA